MYQMKLQNTNSLCRGAELISYVTQVIKEDIANVICPEHVKFPECIRTNFICEIPVFPRNEHITGSSLWAHGNQLLQLQDKDKYSRVLVRSNTNPRCSLSEHTCTFHQKLLLQLKKKTITRPTWWIKELENLIAFTAVWEQFVTKLTVLQKKKKKENEIARLD